MDRICRMGAWACGEKVWKTFMSIEISRNERLRSERTLMCPAAAGVPCEGQALALRAPRRVFFVVRGPSRLYQRDAGFPASPTLPPRLLPHPVHPVNPGHPASDVIDIKVLTDLFCLFRRRSIDMKVFQTFSACSCGLILNILQILTILAILTNNHLPHWWGACMRCHLRALSKASVSAGFPTLIRICSCNPGVLK